MKKITTLIAATLMPLAANAADFTMKFSTPTINDMQHEWIQHFESKVEEATGGRLDVQIFPASQLGPIATVIEGLQLGTIEATMAPAEFYLGVDPRFQVPAAPGLFDSMQDARDKLDRPEIKEAILSIGIDRGVRGVGAVVYGPQILASKKKTENLADLKGQRFRVLASETEISVVNELGAAAVPMPLNEVQAAIQQGAIDGTNLLYDLLVAFKMYDLSPYVLPTELWYNISLPTVSEVWFQSLPEDIQSAILAAADESTSYMFTRQLERMEQARKTWIDNGGKIAELSESDSAAALEVAEGVAETFLAENPNLKELYTLIKGE